MDGLPIALFRAEQARLIDRQASEALAMATMVLMHRAGQAVYDCLRRHWPEAVRIAVVCGPGNNAGDGYVLARLWRQAGLSVRVLCPGGLAERGDAGQALREMMAAGIEPEPFSGAALAGADVIVDALFGSGLNRPLDGPWRQAIESCAAHPAPVLAVDIPSGLDADTGTIHGCVLPAARTVALIVVKQGMLTCRGPGCCGEIDFASLAVPASVIAGVPPAAQRLDRSRYRRLLPRRPRHAHKGDFGRVLVVGGDAGMLGAVRLAATAALRSGAGLVTVATRDEHARMLDAVLPEAMCHAVEDAAELAPLLAQATVIAIGPGLGQARWGQAMLDAVLASDKPLVIDADALQLLAVRQQRNDRWLLTPHPGEAAALLGMPAAATVQQDRFAALRSLQGRYGGVCLLKGSGTLVQGQGVPPTVIDGGNPGMASGGMGDVLTGIVAALRAQGLSSLDAACFGADIHARAADEVAREGGERGLLASDLLARLRPLVNPFVPPA